MKLKTHLSNWAQVLATKPRYWLYLLLSIIVAAIFTLQSVYLAKLTTAVGPQSSAAGTVTGTWHELLCTWCITLYKN